MMRHAVDTQAYLVIASPIRQISSMDENITFRKRDIGIVSVRDAHEASPACSRTCLFHPPTI